MMLDLSAFPAGVIRFEQVIKVLCSFTEGVDTHSNILRFVTKGPYLYIHSFRHKGLTNSLDDIVVVMEYNGPNYEFYARPNDILSFIQTSGYVDDVPTTACPLGYNDFPSVRPSNTIELNTQHTLENLAELIKLDTEKAPKWYRGLVWAGQEIAATDGSRILIVPDFPVLPTHPVLISSHIAKAVTEFLMQDVVQLQAGFKAAKGNHEGKVSFVVLGEGVSVTLQSESKTRTKALSSAIPSLEGAYTIITSAASLYRVCEITYSTIRKAGPALEIEPTEQGLSYLGASITTGEIVEEGFIELGGETPPGTRMTLHPKQLMEAMNGVGHVVQLTMTRGSLTRDGPVLVNGDKRSRYSVILPLPNITDNPEDRITYG